MMGKQTKKSMMLLAGAILCLCAGTVFAVSGTGIAVVAQQVTSNLSNVAKLITAGAYVAGFGFAVAAIVKFKAHKDNPTQISIGMPIVLIFVAAALMFSPQVFKSAGLTLFGTTSGAGTISGTDTFIKKS